MSPKVAEALNQVALPVVPYATCNRMDYWWFQVKSSMICCGYTLPDELKSVCQVRHTPSQASPRGNQTFILQERPLPTTAAACTTNTVYNTYTLNLVKKMILTL